MPTIAKPARSHAVSLSQLGINLYMLEAEETLTQARAASSLPIYPQGALPMQDVCQSQILGTDMKEN